VPSVFGLCLLVVVTTVGLAELALRRERIEHLLGVAVIAGVAFPLLFVAPVAAVAMLAACAATRRLARPAAVPDRVPRHWTA
jgi:hypothetical protein